MERPVRSFGQERLWSLAQLELAGAALHQIIRRHETVRTEEVARVIESEGLRPFDPSRDLMLRALLVCFSRGDHVLTLTMYHIAADIRRPFIGVSGGGPGHSSSGVRPE